MTDTPIRTSLQKRAQSGVTAQETAERLRAFEAVLWQEHGAVVIRLDDGGIPSGLRDMAEAIGIRRYGKRMAPEGGR